jgi:hypothetical protein
VSSLTWQLVHESLQVPDAQLVLGGHKAPKVLSQELDLISSSLVLRASTDHTQHAGQAALLGWQGSLHVLLLGLDDGHLGARVVLHATQQLAQGSIHLWLHGLCSSTRSET